MTLLECLQLIAEYDSTASIKIERFSHNVGAADRALAVCIVRSSSLLRLEQWAGCRELIRLIGRCM